MTPLPNHIQDQLKANGVNLDGSAYLHVTTSGQVIHVGGTMATFALDKLRIGQDMTRHPALAHILPVKSAAMLPSVQFIPGVYCNIHLFPENEWAWLVFINVTTAAAQRQIDQQKRNDDALQRHRDSKKSGQP